MEVVDTINKAPVIDEKPDKPVRIKKASVCPLSHHSFQPNRGAFDWTAGVPACSPPSFGGATHVGDSERPDPKRLFVPSTQQGGDARVPGLIA